MVEKNTFNLKIPFLLYVSNWFHLFTLSLLRSLCLSLPHMKIECSLYWINLHSICRNHQKVLCVVFVDQFSLSSLSLVFAVEVSSFKKMVGLIKILARIFESSRTFRISKMTVLVFKIRNSKLSNRNEKSDSKFENLKYFENRKFWWSKSSKFNLEANKVQMLHFRWLHDRLSIVLNFKKKSKYSLYLVQWSRESYLSRPKLLLRSWTTFY